MKVLHAFTGSVASTLNTKFDEIYRQHQYNVKYVISDSAYKFMSPSWSVEKWDDDSEIDVYHNKDRVLHIDLVKESDVFVIAPCSANTLAKIANGICDNLVTCCARAWDFKKQMIIAPAMNSMMWDHPITSNHIYTLRQWGVDFVNPISKVLYCGDEGVGAMADIREIISKIGDKEPNFDSIY